MGSNNTTLRLFRLNKKLKKLTWQFNDLINESFH